MRSVLHQVMANRGGILLLLSFTDKATFEECPHPTWRSTQASEQE